MNLKLYNEDGDAMLVVTVDELPDTHEVLASEVRSPKEGELALRLGNNGGMWEPGPMVRSGIIATRKEKQIDMSRMVGQYCEFGTAGDIEKLVSIVDYTGDSRLYVGDTTTYSECTPIYGHTYAHKGGECPVPEGFEYKVTLRNGETLDHESVDGGRRHCWTHAPNDMSGWDVMHYEIIRKLEGYKI